MPAFTLDIKVPKGDLAAMAKKTAKALDEVTKREAKLNMLLTKGVKAGKISADLAKKSATVMVRYKKQLLDQQAKELVHGKQKNDSDKKQMTFTEKLSKHYLMVRDAVSLAFGAIKKLASEAIDKGNEIEKMTKALSFQVDMFSANTDSGAQFKELKKFAEQTKVPLSELADQWLKLRKTSANSGINIVDNKTAANMVKVYADIRALSQSSEVAADVTAQWMEKFSEGPDIAARFLMQLKAAHKEWKDIGTGKMAMEITGPMATDDKWKAFDTKLADAIKPLRDLYNGLSGKIADVLSKFVSSKAFKSFIGDMVEGIRWLIDKGLPKLQDAILKFWNFWADIGNKLAESDVMGKFFDGMKAAGDAIDKVYDKVFGGEQKQSPPPAMKPPPMKQSAPADEKKTGMLNQSGAQLAGITIENLNVNGSGQSAEQIARSVRQEMQLLLQAGALSKGYA